MNGDELTHLTIRVALGFYAFVVLFPWLGRTGWRSTSAAGQTVRLCWAAGALAYLVHVALAFHYFHHWSHAEAVAHVQRRSGFGPGIAFSHLFTLVWTADAAWWLIAPQHHERRPAWVGIALHGYMFFIVFNATVVYETGLIRLAGVVLTAALIFSLSLRFRPWRQTWRSAVCKPGRSGGLPPRSLNTGDLP